MNCNRNRSVLLVALRHDVADGGLVALFILKRMIENIVHDLMKAEFDAFYRACFKLYPASDRLNDATHNLEFVFSRKPPNFVEEVGIARFSGVGFWIKEECLKK